MASISTILYVPGQLCSQSPPPPPMVQSGRGYTIATMVPFLLFMRAIIMSEVYSLQSSVVIAHYSLKYRNEMGGISCSAFFKLC